MDVLNEKQNQFKSAVIGLIIVLHGAFLSKNVDFEAIVQPPKNLQKILKIKLKTNRQQIVQTHNKKKSDQFVDSKYLGAINSQVDRETKARIVDKFKVGSRGLEGKKEETQEAAPTKQNQFEKMKFSDLAISDMGDKGLSKFKKQKKRGLKNNHRTTHKDTTSNNDHLEDVALGDFTQLNTQEYEFYGFYHRIREKLEQFWGRNLKSEAEKLYKEGRRIPANQNHVTAVLITLNKMGEVVNVRVKATSGIRELDDAAIDSFNEAGPFPNPPTKMLKQGRATIRWDFVVNS